MRLRAFKEMRAWEKEAKKKEWIVTRRRRWRVRNENLFSSKMQSRENTVSWRVKNANECASTRATEHSHTRRLWREKKKERWKSTPEVERMPNKVKCAQAQKRTKWMRRKLICEANSIGLRSINWICFIDENKIEISNFFVKSLNLWRLQNKRRKTPENHCFCFHFLCDLFVAKLKTFEIDLFGDDDESNFN